MDTSTPARGRGHVAAIALSAVALVVAATGTAVAAAPSVVSLADHAKPSRFVKIDSSGRLAVSTSAGSSSTSLADHAHPGQFLKVDGSGRITANTRPQGATLVRSGVAFPTAGSLDNFVTSPTTATLAVTHLGLTGLSSNTTTYAAYLYQVPVNPDDTCNTTTALRSLSVTYIAPGADSSSDFSTPLLVSPTTAGKPYCLDIYLNRANGPVSSTDSLGYTFAGYVSSGSYSAASRNTTSDALPGKRLAPR